MENLGPFTVRQSKRSEDATYFCVDQGNGQPFAFIAMIGDDAEKKQKAEFLALALNNEENRR